MRLQFASAALLAATSLLPVATAPIRAETASLVWATCTDVPETQCASLDVPIDPARPEGRRLSIRLGRVPAMDPSSNKGTLLFIPGGPGAGVAEMFGAYRGIFNVDELRRERDVVTFDPRGVGQSSPVRCEAEPVPSAPITGITSAEEFGGLERASARFAAGCFERTGELMAHLSAMDTAADIEQIRVALGQTGGLVAYSASYGTNYAAAYVERYGQNVKSLVLDAVFDHSIDLPTLAAHNAVGVEDAFGRFADWCDQDPACALNGKDVRVVFDRVAGAVPQVRAVVGSLLSAGKDPQLGWPAIARMLNSASEGDMSGFGAALSIAPPPVEPELLTGKAGLFRGVLCSDFGPQRDYAGLARAQQVVSLAAPRFGAWKFWDVVGSCIGWPAEASNPPHRLRIDSRPNVMVSNNTHDPATPLINALSVWWQIPGARLLVAHADGHQALAFSRCAFERQIQFWDDPSRPTLTVCDA
jgi:pimeloyl-ACP methyl ester carboxylesterase